nr:terminase small subunit [Cetobacterium sp. 2A]
MKYKDIADKHKVSLNTVKSWKQRYKWCKDEEKVCVQNTKKYAHKSEENNAYEKVVKEEILETFIDSELTDKQRLFCIYYMQNFNAAKAAIKAGYSKVTAMEQGCRLLRNVKVKEYLNELKEFYAQDDYLETKRILERHKQIAFADIKDFVEFKTTEDDLGLKRWNFKIKDDDEVDGTLIKKIGYGSNGPMIELEDKGKSLDFLNKFYGLDPIFEINKEKLKIEKQRLSLITQEKIAITQLKLLETKIKVNDPTVGETERVVEEELEKWKEEGIWNIEDTTDVKL